MRLYQSRHPLPLSHYTDRELNDMAVTLKMVQQATQQDPVMQRLIVFINRGYITDDKALQDYRQVFQELSHWDGVILRR